MFDALLGWLEFCFPGWPVLCQSICVSAQVSQRGVCPHRQVCLLMVQKWEDVPPEPPPFPVYLAYECCLLDRHSAKAF